MLNCKGVRKHTCARQNYARFVNLTRYNRSFEVFRKIHGTSPYYEHAKKELMACLRQRGNKEYKWDTLIIEILQVKEKRVVF